MKKSANESKPWTPLTDPEADRLKMRDILADVDRWQKDGISVAIATVVQTWGSSPRGIGAKMAFTLDGRIAGSVSGGCVENAVIEAGIEAIKSGRAKLLHFGVADEAAWEVGLACGGNIEVFVKPLDAEFFKSLITAWTDDSTSAHVTVIRGAADTVQRELLVWENGQISGDHANVQEFIETANNALKTGKSQRVVLREGTEVFIEVIAPPPALVIVGGVHIAIALVEMAKTLGFRTILIDPRRAWGSEERFPHVDRLIQVWVEEAFAQIRINPSTAIVMLTHDPKLDDPALKIALNSPAFYVGALGSKTTNTKRRERLFNDGVGEARLSRLHAPIGLDIGAQTPEEIALAIMSEVVSVYRKQNQLEVKKEAKPLQSPFSNL